MTSTIGFDPNDPAFIADPYPAYNHLRKTAPISYVEQLNGWFFTRYADVAAILRGGMVIRPPIADSTLSRVPEDVRREAAAIEKVLSLALPFMNPPEHTRLRSVMNSAFTPRSIERMRPRIQELTDQFLDEAEARGSADLVPEIAYRLPATVVLEILGLPTSDQEQIAAWVITTMAVHGRSQFTPDPVSVVRDANQALIEFGQYMQALIDQWRREPTQDLMSDLIRAADEDGRLTDDELVVMTMVIIAGALETTANSIANSVFALLRHPERLKELGADPSLGSAAAEELLRFEPTAQMLPPWIVTETFEVAGQAFQPGDVLWTVIAGANRDPAVFDHPDELDFHRESNKHLGFGVGSHFCPAALLGRMEVEAVCATIARRFPDVHLDPDADYPTFRSDPMVRGLDALPVILR
jgi:cytochrome P450